MDSKKFESEFGNFFYLMLKEQNDIKLSYYLKWKCNDHEHFNLFFKCLHKFKDHFPARELSVPNDKQKKRFYALFRKTVSLYMYIFDIFACMYVYKVRSVKRNT